MRIDLHGGCYLSPVRDGDQSAYVEHFRDKDTTDRLLKIPYPYTHEHAESWVRFCLGAALRPSHFALRRADGFLIGGIGFQLNGGAARHRAEIGYWIARAYRGRGLVTAAVRAMVLYGFDDLGLSRIEATTFSHNLDSHRVLERAGFIREGFLAGYHVKDGMLIDVVLFAILQSSVAVPDPGQPATVRAKGPLSQD